MPSSTTTRNNGNNIKILTTMAYDETKYEPVRTISVFHMISLSILRDFLLGISGFFGANKDFSGVEDKFELARRETEKKLRLKGAKNGGSMIIGVNFNISEMGDKNSVLVCHGYGTLLKRKK